MTDHLTPSEREMLKLAEAATQGPWSFDPDPPARLVKICGPVDLDANDQPCADVVCEVTDGQHEQEDAAFIAASRTAIPALLAEVDRLRGALVKAKPIVGAAVAASGNAARPLREKVYNDICAALAPKPAAEKS